MLKVKLKKKQMLKVKQRKQMLQGFIGNKHAKIAVKSWGKLLRTFFNFDSEKSDSIKNGVLKRKRFYPILTQVILV